MRAVIASALLLGAGIVSMHYVGIHGLAGAFRIEHERAMVVLAVADRRRHRLWRAADLPGAAGRACGWR